MKNKKVKVELTDWTWSCADGCCTNYGTTVLVNGEEMPLQNQDRATIIEQILTHLGYEPEVLELD